MRSLSDTEPADWIPGFHLTRGRARILGPDGQTVWEQDDWQLNTLTREGEQSILATYFGAGFNPNKWLGLMTSDGDVNSTLGTISEQTGFGYARQEITPNGWSQPRPDATGAYVTQATEQTFGPAGKIWVVRNVFLTTSNGAGGFLISFLPLQSQPTYVEVGNSLSYVIEGRIGGQDTN